MRKNLFLALEGIDGSGKSTQLKRLCHRLEQAGHKVYPTFEPTDGPIGAMIRDIFNHRMEADDRTIAGLFVADRLDHLLHKSHGMLKKMEEGFTVVTDRYYFSSYAYHGTHMPMDWVIAANALSAELLRPDLNIFLDISPEQSMKRLSGRNTSIERYETLDNLHNVRNKYMEAFAKLRAQENITIVDANQTEDQIDLVIWDEISRQFGYI
jgi:dTMP kinase